MSIWLRLRAWWSRRRGTTYLSSGTVKHVELRVWVRKDDAGARSVTEVHRLDG